MRPTAGRKITVQRVEETTDGQGGRPKTRIDVATERGRVSSKSDSERRTGDQEQARLTHVCFMRGKADIKVDDRLSIPSMNFLILTVKGIRNPALAEETLEIDCEQIQRDNSSNA